MNRANPQLANIRSELRKARKSGIRTAILVTLLISGIVPALAMYWSSERPGVSFAAQLNTILAVVLQTYPLTLAIAIISFSRKQKWFSMRLGNWFFAGSVIIFCATFGNFLSQWTGHGWIAPAQIMQDRPHSVFGIPAAVVNTFGGFYNAYGFRVFVAAILVGTYAGSTASRFVELRSPRGL